MTKFSGKYSAEHGAVLHEDVGGFVFTVAPANLAPDVAWALNASLHAQALLDALQDLVDEFGSTIEQYHKVGPHWTQKDGNETFDVGVVLDREPLIEAARAIIAKAKATPSDTHEVG